MSDIGNANGGVFQVLGGLFQAQPFDVFANGFVVQGFKYPVDVPIGIMGDGLNFFDIEVFLKVEINVVE